MRTTEAPAYYSCHDNLQIVSNINVQNIFDLNNPQRTTIDDIINSQSTSSVISPTIHEIHLICICC